MGRNVEVYRRPIDGSLRSMVDNDGPHFRDHRRGPVRRPRPRPHSSRRSPSSASRLLEGNKGLALAAVVAAGVGALTLTHGKISETAKYDVARIEAAPREHNRNEICVSSVLRYKDRPDLRLCVRPGEREVRNVDDIPELNALGQPETTPRNYFLTKDPSDFIVEVTLDPIYLGGVPGIPNPVELQMEELKETGGATACKTDISDLTVRVREHAGQLAMAANPAFGISSLTAASIEAAKTYTFYAEAEVGVQQQGQLSANKQSVIVNRYEQVILSC
jgi:hypothetical protein